MKKTKIKVSKTDKVTKIKVVKAKKPNYRKRWSIA